MKGDRSPALLSLGSINADFEVRLPAGGGGAETQRATCLRRLGGGKAANVAFFARRLGIPARLIGQVGDDDLAAQALHPLRDAGVNLDAVSRARGRGTAVSMIQVPADGKKRIVLAPEANDAWSAPAIAAACRAIDDAPERSLLVVDAEIPADVVESALARAFARHLPVILDPSFPDRVRGSWMGSLAALLPNEEEALQLAGLSSARSSPSLLQVALHHLRGQVGGCVAIKQSDGGCLLSRGHGMLTLAAPSMKVVDSTGAGDAFTAAFAIRRLEGADPRDAARFAVAAAALAVTAFGSQPAYPTRQDIEALEADVREVH